jgi:hypothetical protein
MDNLKPVQSLNKARPLTNRRFADHVALPLGMILVLFAFFSTVYSVTTPIFEAPDERDHFLYISWLADGNPLPHIIDDLKTVGHEIGQPPLYYGLVALVVSGIDLSDAAAIAPANPYWTEGGGINVHFHTNAEQFPYQNSVLAVHVGRLVSVLLGMATIVVIYYLARQIMPQSALWVTALVAFNPQFAFMSGVLNNDNLIILLCALTLWLLVSIMQTPHPKRWQYLLLGVLWGAAILTKLSGLALGGIIVLGLGLLAWKHHRWRIVVTGLVLVVVGVAVTAGWWFWHNWQVYGSPLAWEAMLVANQGLLRLFPLSWVDAVISSTFLRRSYWAMFGYGVMAPEPFYWFINGLMILAGIGVLWRLKQMRQEPHWRIFVIHAAWVLLIYAALLRWIRELSATEQGRLLYPAIASIAIFLVWGLEKLPYRRWLLSGTVVVLAVWTAVLPFTTIQSAYAQPKPLSDAAPIPNPQTVVFGEQIHMQGYELHQFGLKPGESLEIDLYWQATVPIEESYTVAVHLLDAAGHVVSTVDTIPYQNRFPTPVWRVGEIFRDRYVLPPLPETAIPGLGSILVTLYPWRQTDKALPVMVHGTLVGSSMTLGSYKIIPTTGHQPPDVETAVTFAQVANLAGYDTPDTASAGQRVPVVLYWLAVQPDGKDYTVFIHLVDETGNLLAQADGVPQNGRFPTTIWAPGEQVIDEHLLTLPPDLPVGTYQIRIGLYDAQSGQRIPAYVQETNRLSDDVLLLHTLTVSD